MDIAEIFKAGGIVMYALVLCSIAVAAIMIDRFLLYRRAEKELESFVMQLPLLFSYASLADVYEKIKEKDNAAACLVQAGVKAALDGGDVRLALDNAYGQVAAQLRCRMNYLSMIVTLSPLLGLLGTIGGMISSFQIFNLQAGQPLAITGGIGEALTATATGLCVAIFALVVHTYFAGKMDTVLTQAEQAEAFVTAELRKRGA